MSDSGSAQTRTGLKMRLSARLTVIFVRRCVADDVVVGQDIGAALTIEPHEDAGAALLDGLLAIRLRRLDGLDGDHRRTDLARHRLEALAETIAVVALRLNLRLLRRLRPGRSQSAGDEGGADQSAQERHKRQGTLEVAIRLMSRPHRDVK